MKTNAETVTPLGRDTDVFPVFRGMGELNVSGREIADVLGVAPGTVSKWRKGKSRMPGDLLVFLTMVLAELVNERETAAARDSVKPSSKVCRQVYRAENCLQQQEVFNSALPREDNQNGAKMFRDWWREKYRLAAEQATDANAKHHMSAVSQAII